jgi:hypothetical protein
MILEWLPPLNQFRALGRFSWGFFYVFSVMSAVWIWNIHTMIQSKIGSAVMFLGIFILYGLDVYSIHTLINKNVTIYGSENLLIKNTNISDIVDESTYDIEDFQGVITLPVSTEGVEKISFEDDFFVKINALPFSYQSGLPLTSCIQSRASTSRVMKILQLANSPYGDHSIQSDITDSRDFLIILPKRLKEEYADVVHQAVAIGETLELLVYAATKDELFEQEYWSDIQDSTFVNIDTSQEQIFIEEYEGQNDFGLQSIGSFYSMSKDTAIMDWPVALDRNTMLELSFWQHIEPDKSTIPSYHFETYNQDHSLRYHGPEFRDWDFDRVEVHGDWIRFTQNISLGNEDKFVSLIVSAPDIRIDWVMMKPATLNVYKSTDNPDWTYFNHYFIRSTEH